MGVPVVDSMKALVIKTVGVSSSEKRLTFFRYLVIVCLMIAAVVCGYGAYSLTYQYEGNLGEEQFDSIAEQFETYVQENVLAKVLALQSHGSMITMSCLSGTMWPNCSVPMNSFFNISTPIISLTKLRTISFSIIIQPEEVTSFEEFAYNFYTAEGYPGVGVSSIGRGIYSINATTKERYHDTHGLQHGERHILAPILEVADLKVQRMSLMYNFYSESTRAKASDAAINCIEAGGTTSSCTSVTDIISLLVDGGVFRPGVLIIHPIVPKYNSTGVTGFVQGAFSWDTPFSDALPNYIGGVDVVLSGGTDTYTFRIDSGIVIHSIKGDHHDSAHDARGRSFLLHSFVGSYRYAVSIYPTDEFVNHYRTDSPWITMGVAVGIIVFTSAFFFMYDLFMNRSSVEKELRTAINTKRLFVRFISHEIRTPLNTVHLGLQLLISEMMTFLSADANKNTPAAAKVHDWMTVIEDIEESADTGILVLNDLINYDKISMGTLSADFELLSLWELVRATTNQHQVAARRAGVKLVLRLEVDDPDLSPERQALLQRLVVVADRIKIAQAIRNLVSNALKFSKQGSDVQVCASWEESGLSEAMVPGELGAPYNLPVLESIASRAVIPLKAQEESARRVGSLVVRVVDSGAGISKENQQSLFQEGKQFRANQLQAGQGSGLGLWISKGLVDLHNGSLTAYSEGEEKGAEFRLELPAVLQTINFFQSHDVSSLTIPTSVKIKEALEERSGNNGAENAAIESEPKSDRHVSSASPVPHSTEFIPPTPHSGAEHNVLVVDDSGPSRKVLCRLLRNMGYTCYEAADGEECVSKMVQFLHDGVTVDVILMDFEMPKMNGPGATKALRDMGCLVPIIGVTGNVLPADKAHFLCSGANAVLHKPLSMDQLRDEISKHQPYDNNV